MTASIEFSVSSGGRCTNGQYRSDPTERSTAAIVANMLQKSGWDCFKAASGSSSGRRLKFVAARYFEHAFDRRPIGSLIGFIKSLVLFCNLAVTYRRRRLIGGSAIDQRLIGVLSGLVALSDR